MGVKAMVAFGGNMGDVLTTFLAARECLGCARGLRILDSSCAYRSPPWGCPLHTNHSSESFRTGQPIGPPGQPDYLNAVVLLDVDIKAEILLQHLQAIEKQHGRVRTGKRWGPRTLDLDLIAYDDTTMQTKHLTLPHPHTHERMFVLQPLCDIRPNWRHPVLNHTASELLEVLAASGVPRLGEGCSW